MSLLFLMRAMRWLYEWMTVCVAVRFSGVWRAASSSITARSISRLTCVSSQRRSSSVGGFLGASSGTTNVANSSVTTMTPQARNMMSSRWGKATTPRSGSRYVTGMVSTTASVMVPFGPPSAMTSDERTSARHPGRWSSGERCEW